ncbi:S locus-related glycoprotein 1 binding pollen coat [Spatholobus suberectus]|nr:S locus-related glycoprotein 1 binding pollen coat [Spatholobus suberectus]
MAERCSSYVILLLLFTLGALMAMVVGDKCKEDLGVCPPKGACMSKCSKIHQGGQGNCEPNGAKNHCMCYYDCKQCEVVLPYIGCVDTQCNSDCAAKFPRKGATGYCVSFGQPYSTCHCQYQC